MPPGRGNFIFQIKHYLSFCLSIVHPPCNSNFGCPGWVIGVRLVLRVQSIRTAGQFGVHLYFYSFTVTLGQHHDHPRYAAGVHIRLSAQSWLETSIIE